MATRRPGRSVSRRSTPSSPPTSSSGDPTSSHPHARNIQNELASNSKVIASPIHGTDRERNARSRKRRAGPAASSKLSPLVEASGSQLGIKVSHDNLQKGSQPQSTPHAQTIAESPGRETVRPKTQPRSTENGRPAGYTALDVGDAKKARGSRRSLGAQAARLAELIAERAQEARTVIQEGPPPVEAVDHSSPPPAADPEPPTASGLEELLQHHDVRTGPVAEVCKTVESQVRQSNKENIDIHGKAKAFVDPQQGAKRVAWAGDSPEVFLHQQDQDQAMATDDEEDDDDFEATIPRDANKRRKLLQRKTAGSTLSQRSSSKRIGARSPTTIQLAGEANESIIYDPGTEESTFDRQPHRTSVRPSGIPAQRKGVAGSQQPPQSAQAPLTSSAQARSVFENSQETMPTGPSDTSPASTAHHLDEVRRMARQRAAQSRRRPVQARSAYTHAEEERLLDLIEFYGISYSLVKEMDSTHVDGPLLEDRSQVQLKDKAQELKFQFLKAGTGLPANFDKIPLRSRMKDQLERLGIFEC